MGVNWPFLFWGLHRAIQGQTRDIRALASATKELAPSVTTPSAPALYPKGALDQITGLSPWRSWEVEQTLIAGGAMTHGATIAHEIEDVWVSGGYVFKQASKADVGHGSPQLWDEAWRTDKLEAAHLVSCYAGSKFFGTYMLDTLSLELLPGADASPIAVPTKSYPHSEEYRALLSRPAPAVVQRARIKQLTFYEDFGQNPGKRARYQTLRQRLRETVPTPDKPPVGIYLKRGTTGEPRLLTNEAALEDRLAGLGFDIVEPATLTAAEVARRTMEAPLVISVEGSHLSHVIYSMAETGALLVLQPPDRFAMAYKEFTDCMDMRFGFVVGTKTEEGFSIKETDVLQMVDRLMP